MLFTSETKYLILLFFFLSSYINTILSFILDNKIYFSLLEVDDDNAFNSASRIYRGQGHDDLLLCEGDLCACNFDPHMQNQPLVSDHAYSIGQIMNCTLSITL